MFQVFRTIETVFVFKRKKIAAFNDFRTPNDFCVSGFPNFFTSAIKIRNYTVENLEKKFLNVEKT